MRKSEMLAESIYGAFRKDRSVRLRNVKQAGFAVLKSLEIPAVLVEVGFLSNRKEAARLRKDSVREEIATNLLQGIEEYFSRAGSPSAQFHVVQEGETAWSIASLYRMDVSELLSANNLRSDSVLRVGQRLRIR